MRDKGMGINARVAVITGATGGLGRVVAQRLAEAGARLVLVGTRSEKLEGLIRELTLDESRTHTIVADLSLSGSAQSVLNATISRFGHADVLLHLVGGWIGGKPVPRVEAEEVTTMLEQHLWTTFHLAQAFGPHMVSNGWGRIVVVSSPSAAQPPANVAPYAIGKSAQEALMLALAEEFKGTGVTANILRVRTIDIKHQREFQPSSKTASWTTPEEIAAAMLYLCSDDAVMVNGARIPLYGAP